MSKTTSLGYYWPSLCDVPSTELESGLEVMLRGETPRLSRNSITVIKQLFDESVEFLNARSNHTSYSRDACDAYCFLAKATRFGEHEKYPHSDVIASERRIEESIRRVSELVGKLPEIDLARPKEDYASLKEILGKIKQYSRHEDRRRSFSM